MDIGYNIINVIDFLGLIQGIILGAMLILGNKGNRPSLFLGLFLLTYSAEIGIALLSDTLIIEKHPNLFFLPIKFFFTSLPLLYLYVRQLSEELHWKTIIIVLIPGILEFSIFSIFLIYSSLSPFDIQEQLIYQAISSGLYELQSIVGLVFSVIVGYLTFRKVSQIQKRVKDYYSDLQERHLKWIKHVALFLIFFASLFIVTSFISSPKFHEYLYPIVGIVNVIFIYWVGFSGLKQIKVELPKIKNELLLSTKNSNDENTLDKEYQVLLEFMKMEQPFTNSNLTLTDLAQQQKIAPKRLSQIINQKAGLNFNKFVNQYRVDAAKKMLTDHQYNHLNVIGIGLEVGFNSKASFYSVFKQFTNTTPAKFKKMQSKLSV